MIYDPQVGSFFAALVPLLVATGEVDRNDPVTTESLDRALRAYIKNVIDDINYYESDVFDA
jgi:hypothetical protein